MAYDPNYFLGILSKATGETKEWNKKALKQNNISGIENKINSHSYSLDNTQQRFLESYLNDLNSHKDDTKMIKVIERNFSEIKDIFDDLQQEVNQAVEEERKLEDLAKDLEDQDVLNKIENFDKPKIEKIRKKLNHALKIEEEMEKREESLENLSENFNHISETLNQRINIVEKTIQEDRNASGSSSDTKIISISDVRGSYGEYESTKKLLNGGSCSFPSLSNGDYKIIVNGNAFDYNDKNRGSGDMLNEIDNLGGRGDLEYIFGNMDQYILFKEFWSAVEQGPDNYAESFHIKIGENNRLNFIQQIYEDDGYIKGVSTGKYEYNYANAGPSPDGRTNERLGESAQVIWDLKMNKEPENSITDSKFNQAVTDMSNRFDLNKHKSDHKLGDIIMGSNYRTINRDLDFSTGGYGNIEALIAIQYLIQFENYDQIALDDGDEIFDPNKGTLWKEWNEVYSDHGSSFTGKFILGKTLGNQCSQGGSQFFNTGDNPRYAKNGYLINERTISSPDPNSLIVEEPGGNITAIRENPNSGDIEEESL